MHVERIHVAGYRSARDVHLELDRVNVLVGPNGCGKTNLYRALMLLAAAAEGRLSRTLAEEGGMPSALWAGPRRRHQKARLTVGLVCEGVGYELSCGLPTPQGGWPDADGRIRGCAFALDPEVKEERIWVEEAGERTLMAERTGKSAWLRDGEGRRASYPVGLDAWESLLVQVQDPHRYPELSLLRDALRSWRFYHLFRTDLAAPLRQPQVGVRTLALGHGGDDLAAALQTILEIGDGPGLHAAVEAAFPGARLEVATEGSRFDVRLLMPGVRRPFDARELSDGTLRYLCLLAALKSPRPPLLLALNEPETSLHPDLLGPLADLVIDASTRSQLWVTTHSRPLAEAIAKGRSVRTVELDKVEGETRVC